MKTLIYASHGFRGDVQPYLALAYAIDQSGHSAVLAAPRRFASLAADHGVRFIPLNDELLGLYSRPDVQEALLHSDAPTSEQQKLRVALHNEIMPRIYPTLLGEMWNAASTESPDIIVYSHAWRQAIHQIAERLDLPHVLATLYPHFVPSRDYPSGGGFSASPSNLASHEQANRNLLDPLTAGMVSSWRSEVLGLPPREDCLDYRHGIDGTPTPVLHGFSAHELPHSDDWPKWVHTTGFWRLPTPADWAPPAHVQQFLERGDTPIAVGFGSMTGPDTEKIGRTVLEAVRNTGYRAVIVTGWGGISIADPPENVLVVDDVPYEWLFPRVRAAVHAGGIGTHNAAFLAGIPQVACPFHAEQLMWSEHLHSLGVAPPPIKQRDLTAEALTNAIRLATTDPDIARAATHLASKMQLDDGCGSAVEILQNVYRSRARASS